MKRKTKCTCAFLYSHSTGCERWGTGESTLLDEANTKNAALKAEVKRLRKALRSIEAGDLCGRSEQGGCEWGVDGPCLSCEATAALAPRARNKPRRGGA